MRPTAAIDKARIRDYEYEQDYEHEDAPQLCVRRAIERTTAMNDGQISRRTMIRAAATAAAVSTVAPSRALGANDRINLAFIGTGGMGTGHVGTCSQMRDVNIVAVCDVDESRQRRAADVAGTSPKTYTDFRRVVERNDVDAVVIATPEHWHPLIACAAFDAGKDVYTEKPLGHNVREGRVVAERAAQHGRICQVGLQQRSGPHWQHAVERIRSGELGKVSMVHAWNAWNPREAFGDFGRPDDGPAPPGVNYDLWLGPAPLRPFNRGRFHGTWYFFWDYSGALVSGWGVHLFDIVQWAMGHEIERVAAVGGNFVVNDARETPDTFSAVFSCPSYTLDYSLRHGNGWRAHDDMDHGIEFFGDWATMQINRGGYRIYREQDRTTRSPFYTENAEGNDYEGHLRNFFDCVRSRNEVRCPTETGHRASVYGHLANIAYRTGRTVAWDSTNEHIAHDDGAAKLLTREYRKPWVL